MLKKIFFHAWAPPRVATTWGHFSTPGRPRGARPPGAPRGVPRGPEASERPRGPEASPWQKRPSENTAQAPEKGPTLKVSYVA